LLHRCKADRYQWSVDIQRCADFHDRHAVERGHIYTCIYIMGVSINLYSCGDPHFAGHCYGISPSFFLSWLSYAQRISYCNGL
jgi:hypothetical protein